MISCDKLLVSQIVEKISYNDLTLHTGIANNIRGFEYSSEEVYFPDGRGYVDFVDFIHKIGIKFREISLKDLENENEFENVVVFIPKEMLEIDEKDISVNANYLNIIYSAFNIIRYDDKHIILSLVANKLKYEKVISLKKLQMIQELKSKPLSYTVKIIFFEKQLYQFDIFKIKNRLKNNLKSFLYNSTINSNETICYCGPQFYKKFYDVFLSMLENINENHNKIKAFIFVKAFNAGSESLFRKDFIVALQENKLVFTNIDMELEALLKAEKRWCEIGRILRGVQNSEVHSFNKNKLKELLSEIEYIELEAINNLIKKI